MAMGMEIGILLAYGFGILALYIVGYLLLVPFKFLLRLIGNSILGGLLIILINLLGGGWGIAIPLNFFSALLVGVLGIPGAILLVFLN